MRKKSIWFAASMAAVLGTTSLTGFTSLAESAEDETELVAVSYQDEGAWEQVAITNSEYVTTALNIRSDTSTESDVLGYLYQGTAVWVIERGETWTQIYSNGITGYVMSDYLLYGEDVAEIAEVYGVEGVRAEWDEVNVYTSSDAATVKDTMETGEVFQVVNDYGHWIEIQYSDGSTAYVSEDDVSSVMLFESAATTDGERVQLDKLYSDTYSETGSDVTAAAETTYTETAQTETTYTEAAQTETTNTEAAQTETTYTEAAQTEATYTETETTYTEAETTYTEAAYTETEQTETVYTEAAQTETTYTEAAQTETAYIETEQTETTYTEAEQTETTYTETETTAATEASSSSVSTDDTTLLAALIYCEAGNQSYEGMVAVGAVVMNRVNSSSFPSTISGVIYQSGQFGPASSGVLAKALANGVPSTCYTAAAAAIAGEDPTGGALYFNTTAGKGVKIGDHWFY